MAEQTERDKPQYSGHWQEVGGRLYYIPSGPGPHPEVREITLPPKESPAEPPCFLG